MHADGAALPEPPMGDALPDHEPTFTAADLADSPAPESITEIAILGTLDTSSFEFNGAPPLNGAAAVEDSQFFEGEEPKVTDVSPVSIIGAKGLDGRVLNGTSDQEVVTAAICGVNSLQSSRYTQVSIASYLLLLQFICGLLSFLKIFKVRQRFLYCRLAPSLYNGLTANLGRVLAGSQAAVTSAQLAIACITKTKVVLFDQPVSTATRMLAAEDP
jgi:hypothetical protein